MNFSTILNKLYSLSSYFTLDKKTIKIKFIYFVSSFSLFVLFPPFRFPYDFFFFFLYSNSEHSRYVEQQLDAMVN